MVPNALLIFWSVCMVLNFTSIQKGVKAELPHEKKKFVISQLE